MAPEGALLLVEDAEGSGCDLAEVFVFSLRQIREHVLRHRVPDYSQHTERSSLLMIAEVQAKDLNRRKHAEELNRLGRKIKQRRKWRRSDIFSVRATLECCIQE